MYQKCFSFGAKPPDQRLWPWTLLGAKSADRHLGSRPALAMAHIVDSCLLFISSLATPMVSSQRLPAVEPWPSAVFIEEYVETQCERRDCDFYLATRLHEIYENSGCLYMVTVLLMVIDAYASSVRGVQWLSSIRITASITFMPVVIWCVVYWFKWNNWNRLVRLFK
jgi:hypothetical protein